MTVAPLHRVSPTAAQVAIVGLAVALGLLAGADPSYGVAAAAGLSFVALLFADYTLASGVFVVTTFLALPSAASKPIGGLLVAAWVALIATRRNSNIDNFISRHSAISLLIIAFLAWTLAGVAWAESPGAVLTGFSRYGLNCVLFLVVYTAVKTRRNALVLSIFFVLGVVIAAGDGIINPPAVTTVGDVSRAGGTFGDPNELAAVLVVGVLVSVAVALNRAAAPALRMASIGAAVLSVAGILLSLSRGGLIAMGVALLAGVAVAGRWRALMALLTLTMAFATVSYYAFYASPAARERVTQTNGNGGGSGRVDLWRVAGRMINDHPIHGVGTDNFQISSVHYLLLPGALTRAVYIVDKPKATHNMYLQVLSEEGFIGLGMFLAMIGFSLRCFQRAWRRFRATADRDMEILTYALFIGLVGFLAASIFLSEEYSKQLWLLLALGPALLRVSGADHAATTSSPAAAFPRTLRPVPAGALGR